MKLRGGHEIMAAWGPLHRYSPESYISKAGIPALFCALRVKAVFNSLLSLICSRIKECGEWVEPQRSGPGVGCVAGRSPHSRGPCVFPA